MKYTIYTRKIGCTRVKTGVNGCLCVCMGALGCRGHGEHKVNLKGRKLCSHRPYFGPYGRGNFPEHHVLQNKNKMGTNGPRGVLRCLQGCDGAWFYGDTGKQGETTQKSAIGTCFSIARTGNKTSHSWQG